MDTNATDAEQWHGKNIMGNGVECVRTMLVCTQLYHLEGKLH